jgi:hypothetical protein
MMSIRSLADFNAPKLQVDTTSSPQDLMIRTAISPRFATRTD